ncbi:MAG: lipoprotein-releasing ABC transporter permease subunit [Rhodospirillales bacterium]|jgi:lipoprotein-releasing system permease protein|nr:lipoprotein-releasing ABC transporter permease subunit [Rhodospirillales bacterium]MBT4038663.1 lipoprotein-releasing ABC transporter permease subunit [Rhodospirillales bacterium]MBT4628511.1 lipoprotein-releasing ABC transporter permease subunit [Rhodospirillales bacterium]MBT5350440.1 lipoprotein-releasing ABC transporter permease subunit [Rhodospirillales bacterium]MBT5520037.1 lipoprotein-releasing ABC transporter permease subunit [Rhodospirillales bacterium]
MFSAFEWMLAMRYLRARRQEGFISVIAWFSLLGIGLGVATLIIVMSVMNGFREELLSRILGINGHLNVSAQSRSLTDYEPLRERLQAVPGVIAVSPLVEGQVMATHNGVSQGAVVRGLEPSDLRGRELVASNIVAGDLSSFEGNNSIVIGRRLARKLGVPVGGNVNLISPKGTVTAFGTVPRMKSYQVVALFDVGMYEYDSGFVFMPLEAAQVYFSMKKGISNLEVFLDNPQDAPSMTRDIAKVTGPSMRIHDWQRANASFFNAIQVERNVMFLILTLIIVVAAFNIISSMIMLVKDKGSDIAILRTMGATRGTIMRIFFISGTSIGVIGTLGGFVAGLSFAANIETIRQWIQGLTGSDLFAAEIYFLSQLPAVVDPVEVTAIVLMALGLSILATLYPSWRAARTDPAEALRYE